MLQPVLKSAGLLNGVLGKKCSKRRFFRQDFKMNRIFRFFRMAVR